MGGPRDLAFKGIQNIHDQGMYGCVVCCTVIHSPPKETQHLDRELP